jgi:hypothetical protein
VVFTGVDESIVLALTGAVVEAVCSRLGEGVPSGTNESRSFAIATFPYCRMGIRRMGARTMNSVLFSGIRRMHEAPSRRTDAVRRRDRLGRATTGASGSARSTLCGCEA